MKLVVYSCLKVNGRYLIRKLEIVHVLSEGPTWTSSPIGYVGGQIEI